MGRAERRAYNRKHKTNLTREQFDAMIAVARIQAGNFDMSGLDVPDHFMHMDNTEIVPDGTVCKLNYDAIMSRPNTDKIPEFLQWVEEHKDVELHVSREGATESLIRFEEDNRYKTDPETGEQVEVDPWLFDTYTDILVKDIDGQYRSVTEIEEAREKAVKQNIDQSVLDNLQNKTPETEQETATVKQVETNETKEQE